jgi:hypothetical protein
MFNRLFIEPGGTELDDETVIHFTVHCARFELGKNLTTMQASYFVVN